MGPSTTNPFIPWDVALLVFGAGIVTRDEASCHQLSPMKKCGDELWTLARNGANNVGSTMGLVQFEQYVDGTINCSKVEISH